MSAKIDTTCRVCFSHNDGHSSVSGDMQATPSDGDISMCAYCGTLGKFEITDDKARIVPVEGEELEEMLQHPDIQKAIALGRAISASRRG